MKLRLPIYGKILGWFFLNLLLLGAAVWFFFRAQFHLGLDSLFLGQAGERMHSVASLISQELEKTSDSKWDEVLQRFGTAYHVQFFLFRPGGGQVAGEPLEIPPRIKAHLAEGRPAPADRVRDRNFRGGRPPPEPPPEGLGPRGPEPPRGHFMQRTEQPTRYWLGVRVRPVDALTGFHRPLMLVAMSPSLRASGLFFDPAPWFLLGSIMFVGSILLWFPFVRGLTRSISQISQATLRISRGDFSSRIAPRRGDELGALAEGVDRMAERLEGYVKGQKRFLGGVAHELCTPLSRIQMALGILESKASSEQKSYVEDLREEVQLMSNLVNELLSFSKASMTGSARVLQPVRLAETLQPVLNREGAGAQLEVYIPSEIEVTADPDLLARSIANIIRNAVRYAGSGGPIVLAASRQGDRVALTISDSGPGVPEKDLPRLFDPFFRVEESRSRELGGVGLGMTIVKSCIEACEGTVTCRNRQPHGLEVEIRLRTA